jgi:transposase InsO family protein
LSTGEVEWMWSLFCRNARTVMNQLPKWFEDYNDFHPHKALKMKSLREYKEFLNKLEQCPV